MLTQFVVPFIKIPLRKRSALTLFTNTRVVTAKLLIKVKYTVTFFESLEHTGISKLTRKSLKVSNSQQCQIIYLNVNVQ